MNYKSFAPMLLALSSLGLAACGASDQSDSGKTGWAGIAEKAQAEIRKEMASNDLDIGKGVEGLPRAALTPDGDLMVNGEKVPTTPEQREKLLAFRSQLAGLAEAGAAVGIQGAALATDALKEAAKAALSGDKTSIEERMKPQAEAIKATAQALCDRLPALLAAQRAAAEAVPEFQPYATMDEKDVGDCKVDHEGAAR